MNRFAGFAMLSVVFTLSASLLEAQEVARLAAGGGKIEIVRGSSTTVATAREAIQEGEKIRTGIAAFATLELNRGSFVMLGEESEVEFRKSAGESLVSLLKGSIRVTSDSEISISTKRGRFTGTGGPVEFDLSYGDGETANLVVARGAVESGGIVVRSAAVQSDTRTYSAGTLGLPRYWNTTPFYPNIAVYPYFGAPQNCLPQPQQQYSPSQVVPPMTDPMRPPVHFPVNPFPYRPRN